jgi:HlyD family secretion protein
MKWQNLLAKVWRFVIYLIILTAGLFIARRTVLRPPAVEVQPVMRRNVAAEVQGTGTVTADVLAKVGSKITGRVEKIFVDERDRVRKGEIVAVVDSTDLRREADRASAHLAAARAAAWEEQQEWGREKLLVASGAVSQEESDQYQERFLTAQSSVEAAQADLRFRQYEVSLAQIPTLVSGVVVKRWVDPGDTVVPGQPIITVAATRLIYVNAFVDQSFAGKIRAGQSATVILRGRENDPIPGRVYRIAPEADPAAEEMTVEVSFTLPARELEIGQWAEVYIKVGAVEHVLAVPASSLAVMGDKSFVLVAGTDGRLRRVMVDPIARSPRSPFVAVKGEIKQGEQVVIKPMGLRPGEKVRIAGPRAPGTTARSGEAGGEIE